MRIEVVSGEATQIPGDVLALKYAQARYGLDSYVAEQLRIAGRAEAEMSPLPDGFQILPSPDGVTAASVLFVGVVPLWEFDYKQIRAFARKVLVTLAVERPMTKTVIVTVHGPGYGLDETEAFTSEIAGFLDAIRSGDVPDALELIQVVERNEGRAARLQDQLSTLLLGTSPTVQTDRENDAVAERLRSVGYASASKRHVFVAMPFADEMEDVFHYGIQNAVNSVGWLCERADLSAFTGDVMEWVQNRIKTASLVIADLSGANPNVYLELGFAWGCGTPAVLLARDSNELRFDVRGQRCLLYKSIKDLEGKLSSELGQLIERRGV
jgi:hypothetical protein